MEREQIRDLREAVEYLRTACEGNPNRVIGDCTIFKALNGTCNDCPFMPTRTPYAECKLRKAIALIEGTIPVNQSFYNTNHTIRKSAKTPEWLNQVMNEGDGEYKA